MNLHEFQAKALLAERGVPIPAGQVAWTAEEAARIVGELGGACFAVKAQIDAHGETRFFPGKTVSSLPENATVILANSFDAPKLCPVPHLRLRRVRGQLTYVPEAALEPPHVVVLRGGMVLPPADGLCVVGASYDIDDEDASPRADSHAGNLERMKEVVAFSSPDFSSLKGRVGFRAVTRDRLPVVGRIADNVYGAFACGSRGLVWAALAAELIASELEGEPLPVEGTLADALSPARFARRALRPA